LSVKKRIAITGHTKGIGQALKKIYEARGHEIVGLSRSNNFNISSPNALSMIEDCDILINNAHCGFEQTVLLYKVYKMWKNNNTKQIINISSILPSYLLNMKMLGRIPLNDDIDEYLYTTEKLALEEAFKQLRMIDTGPRLVLVRPGTLATDDNEINLYANVNEWAQSLVDCLSVVHENLEISEITISAIKPKKC